MSQIDLYQQKNVDYYGEEQVWISRLIDGQNLKMLDIGCGDGITGRVLKEQGIATHITGIEIVPESAERAREHLDEVITGNVEEISLSLEPESFDAIIMTELLEHLVNPWQLVREVKTYLKPDGIMVASSPNVRHFSVIWSLIRGTWQYQERGIMDKTHLRFFTKTTFMELFTSAGLTVELIEPIMNKKYHFVSNMLFKQPEGLITPRYRCRVRKST